MSRVFTDDELLTWEAFPSGGPFGYPDRAAIVFQCLSDPDRRARYVRLNDDNASAERFVVQARDAELKALLEDSKQLD